MCECCGGDCKLMNEESLGPSDQNCITHDLYCGCDLKKCIEDCWPYLQSNNRCDVTLRASAKIMYKWKNELDDSTFMAKSLTERLISLGKAQMKLKEIVDDDFLDQNKFSKHNEWWDSEHETESDKLDDCRRKFSHLHDMLWDLWSYIHGDEE